MRKSTKPLMLALVAFIAIGAAACVPRPASAPSGSCFEVACAADAIHLAFPEPGLYEQALAVARCESGHRPWAENGQYKGLFQMGSNYYGTLAAVNDGRWENGVTNALAARVAFDASGWGPWSCKP